MASGKVLDVYADGGTVGTNPSELGGTWAFCHVDLHGKRVLTRGGVITPADAGTVVVTSCQAEFYAMLMAVEALEPGWNGTLWSDSLTTVKRFKGRGTPKNIRAEWWQRMADTVGRLGYHQVRLLAGHATRAELEAGCRGCRPVSRHNTWCHDRCSREAFEWRVANRI